MPTTTDRLEILVDISGDGKAKVSLAGVGNAAQGVEQKTKGMSKGLTASRIAMAALAYGSYRAVTAIIKTTAEFERLNAMLKTVTGSQEGATQAMGMIKAMASRTPFSVTQLTDSFIKLKALGLDPSEEALISYGNTAAAMGKDLNQMIEAVADAATGEFERLKEFGIKARQNGDEVSLTFQGVTTTIKNNSQAIQQYLLDIGNTQFAGAMEQQMDTLNGAFSNLGDSVDLLFDAIGKSGLGQAVKETTQDLSGMVGVVTQNIEQLGFLEGSIIGVIKALAGMEADKPLSETKRAVMSLGFSMRETQKHADEFASFIAKLEQSNLPPQAIEPYRVALQQALDTIKALQVAQDELTGKTKPEGEANQSPERAGLAKDFERLQQELQSERDELLTHYTLSQQIVQEAFEYKKITEQEQNTLLQQIESDHLNKMLELDFNYYQRQAQLDESAATRKTRSFLSGMKGMTAGLAQHSKTLFDINKAATLSQIAMDTPAAISGAYKWGASIGGPPAGAAAALVAAYAQHEQFQAAQETTFGGKGKGTTPSSAGTTPVVNDQPVAPDGSNYAPSVNPNPNDGISMQVIFQGSNIVGRDGMEQLTEEYIAPAMRKLLERDVTIIPSNSRQARELQAA